jgi:nucleoside-diphosphate-sugar epimerase
MRALITGATGFIGSHLAEALHSKGYALRCLVRPTSDRRWIRHLPVEYVYGSFFDERSLNEAVANVDVVYHSAGVVASKTKKGFFEGNQLATRNLLAATQRANRSLVRFVHISSQAAVGPSAPEHPVNEETPYHPITTYGISKMEAEKEVRKYDGLIPWTIVRPPAVYGPRDTATLDFFRTASRGIIPLVGFTRKIVSLVHVRDLVTGIILAGEKTEGQNQVFFVGSQRHYDWEEIGYTTLEVLGRKAICIRVPEFLVYAIAGISGFFSIFKTKPSVLNWEKGKDMVQQAWTCDDSKARSLLGYKDTISLKEGIRETIDWYRKVGWMK